MARNGSGVYSLPAGSTIVNGDLSDATDLNTPLADIAADLNIARPVVAGGTGASDASTARTNLGLGTMATQVASSVAITGGTITGATVTLAADAVATAMIQDNAVTTAKILDANVTADKLASNAVTTAKIIDDAVTRAKILDAAMSGDDATLITGTAGTSGNLAQWNAGGDLVDAGISGVSSNTFTPVIADASTAGNTATLSEALGYYEYTSTKVDFFFTVTLTSKGSMTAGNALYIRGLPNLPCETGGSDVGALLVCGLKVTSGSGPSFVYYSVPTSTNTFTTFTDDPADIVGTALLVSEFPTTFSLTCHGTYFRNGIV